MDLSLMDGSIEIIGDVYFSELEDLLVDAPVPGSAGEGQSSTIINAATMDRSGWEFSFRYRKLDGNLKFDITANVFQNKNEVTYLPLGDMYGLHSITSVGQPIGQIYATPVCFGLNPSHKNLKLKLQEVMNLKLQHR